ncbi:MAG: DnaA/Hda family protein [Planctomycetota bacterium]|nr:DnaA/Hda family protein [Planctomycetota bacterium]
MPSQSKRNSPTRSRKLITEKLTQRIGSHRYDMWFGHAQMKVEGDLLDIATDSEFVANWIDKHFSGDLKGIAEETLGNQASIKVHVAPDLFGRQETTRKPSELDPVEDRSSARRSGSSGKTTSRHTVRVPTVRLLSEFIVGESNRLAHSSAIRLVEDDDAQLISPLFLHSECGLGKTYLLRSIGQRFGEITGRPQKVRYLTAEQFTNEYIASIRAGTLDSFRAKMRKLDLLAIDDVHFFSNKVRTQSEFLHTLDELDLAGARIAMASDEHPRHIRKFSQALISRFLSGMVVKIDRPGRTTRLELIHKFALTRGLNISEAAAEEIATHCVGSIRELEGSITKLFALKTLVHRHDEEGDGTNHNEIGLVLAEQLFKDQGWQPSTPVRMNTILGHVCERLAISKADLMSSGRHRRVVLARALVAYLGRELTTQSYPEIARELGRSYHSTVHTAAQRLKKQMVENKPIDLGGTEKPLPLRELVDQLRHEILKATGKS